MEARHLHRKEGFVSRALCEIQALQIRSALYSQRQVVEAPSVVVPRPPDGGSGVRAVVHPRSYRSSTRRRASTRPPRPTTSVICPVCEEAGKKSTVRDGPSRRPTDSRSTTTQSEDRYWDEDGRYHDHELARELLVCSRGCIGSGTSTITAAGAEWPNGRYMSRR